MSSKRKGHEQPDEPAEKKVKTGHEQTGKPNPATEKKVKTTTTTTATKAEQLTELKHQRQQLQQKIEQLEQDLEAEEKRDVANGKRVPTYWCFHSDYHVHNEDEIKDMQTRLRQCVGPHASVVVVVDCVSRDEQTIQDEKKLMATLTEQQKMQRFFDGLSGKINDNKNRTVLDMHIPGLSSEVRAELLKQHASFRLRKKKAAEDDLELIPVSVHDGQNALLKRLHPDVANVLRILASTKNPGDYCGGVFVRGASSDMERIYDAIAHSYCCMYELLGASLSCKDEETGAKLYSVDVEAEAG